LADAQSEDKIMLQKATMRAPKNEGYNPLTLSIDWEDFGQLIAQTMLGVQSTPHSAIDRQTHIILDLLAETGQKATFFVLGMLAKDKPHLVKALAAAGHEIAIHGNNHKRLESLSPAEVRTDILDAKHLVEDLVGEPVYGYRAPCFSIAKRNNYVLDILSEHGFLYDSSIFPMRLPKYGYANFHPQDALYQLPSGGTLVELPLTVVSYMGRRWPVSGGGYFRALPKRAISAIFRHVARSSEQAHMIYMHPYEFDSQALHPTSNFPPGQSLAMPRKQFLRLRWNFRRTSIIESVKMLLMEHTFITCKERADHVTTTTERPRILERSQHPL